MPVNIYRIVSDNEKSEQIAYLCDDEWELCPQIDALSEWMEKTGATLQPAEYVADVGFCWRRDAGTRGPVLAPPPMRRMADLGISLFLSEYPGFADGRKDEDSSR